jgi:thiamine biosynthesis lipoprotein
MSSPKARATAQGKPLPHENRMNRTLDRRRFVAISAAAGGLALMPFGLRRKAAAGHVVEWRGTSLGSVATIRIHHRDKAAAQRLIDSVVGEARRLEGIFSLYRDDSTLCELNRHGVLTGPPAELFDLLAHCDRYWRLTGGVFDPTVQPLWRCYWDHFSAHGAASPEPAADKRREALELVGWDKVRFDRDKVVLARRGMGLTLNGIAQGYITDRVVERLRMSGIDSSMVDMGEIGALGGRPDGNPWQVGLEDGQGAASAPISIIDKAVATSGSYGFRFNELGTCNHLFNPATGACAEPSRIVAVVADTATTADALSTAFALIPDQTVGSILAQTARVKVYVARQGAIRQLSPDA